MADATSSRHERRRVLYSGRVQGVGFRYSARQIAGPYDVTGFLRNLPDGRVELVAEGPPGELNGMLSTLSERMADHIDHALVDVLPATNEFDAFEIRH